MLCRLREGEPFDWFDSVRSLTTGRYARSWRADLHVRLGWTLALQKIALEMTKRSAMGC
jgi:hypothetical protein